MHGEEASKMNSEKFSLRWNDFQSTVSQSLGLLRKEEDFFDVTLVSEDHSQMSAHKVVLSACSPFFKNIFRSNSHSHPLLYLGSINSIHLGFILDYIYQGEVHILQDQLDGFLQAARRLNVEGLMEEGEGEESMEHKRHLETKYCVEVKKIGGTGDIAENEMLEKEILEISNSNHRIVDRIKIQENTEANERINELIEKVAGKFSCKVCGKISTHLGNHRKHIETHIEGLSYSCQFCDQVFRHSNARNIHMTRYHRN